MGLARPTRAASTAATALWAHPDMLPTADDLDDPDGFVHRERTRRSTSPRWTRCSATRPGDRDGGAEKSTETKPDAAKAGEDSSGEKDADGGDAAGRSDDGKDDDER